MNKSHLLNLDDSHATDHGQPLIENQISEKWLTTEEAANYLRISEKCLLNLCSAGKIPYYKLERRNRYLEHELRKILMTQSRGGSNGL